MTAVVCLKCGSFKKAAFLPCTNCGHAPESREDKIEHLMFSDHVMRHSFLERLAAEVKIGRWIEPDANDVIPGREAVMASLVESLVKLESSGGNDPEFDELMKMIDDPLYLFRDRKSSSSSKGCLGLIALLSVPALILALAYSTFI
jgi:hypothetical protein